MAGRLNIATTGALDQWLTGNPTFSHALYRFRKHTPFSIEMVETPFDGHPVDFGHEISCRVPQGKGDAIRNMTLKVTLPDPSPDTFGKNDNYYPPSVVSHMIERADLLIGNQLIQRLTGEYIYMYHQLNHSDDDLNQSIYFMSGHGNILSYSGRNYTYYLDLPFYFHGHSQLAIPTCALTRQLVEVRIKLRPFSEMLFLGGSQSTPATGSIVNISLDSEFVFFSPEERAFLASRPQSYVITQLQKSEFKIPYGETKRSVLLKFTNPVKELFIVSQSEYAETKNLPNNYNKILNAELRFNNAVVFNAGNLHLTYAQALRRHVNSPMNYASLTTVEVDPTMDGSDPDSVFTHEIQSEFAMYSWSRHPERYYPTGQVNFSRVAHKLFTVEIEQRSTRISPTAPAVSGAYTGHDNKVRVYAVSYNVLTFNAGCAGLKYL